MKRLLVLMLILSLVCLPGALAETVDYSAYSDEDLSSVGAEIFAEQKLRGMTVAEIIDLTSLSDEELIALTEAIAAEQQSRGYTAPHATLERGSKGEEVRLLQERLIELNYLSGTADGDFGGKTASAVELFQKEVGLPVNGIADDKTQDALFAADAPKAKIYLDLDFNAISRDPDKYEGKNYQFSGRVLQVMEEEYNGKTIVAMRIATKGNYDNVVYIMYIRGEGESRILEDDRVTVHGVCEGLYSYETVRGDEVTLPYFIAETITLK